MDSEALDFVRLQECGERRIPVREAVRIARELRILD
jgi:hypothetical protein